MNDVWNSPPIPLDPVSENTGSTETGNAEGEIRRQCIPTRDFMVLRIAAHELDEVEIREYRELEEEVKEVMASWAEDGGAWVKEGESRRWVGVGDEPPSS